jgi:hypothetical protein
VLASIARAPAPNGSKAQMATCSRDVAVTYKETLDRLKYPLHEPAFCEGRGDGRMIRA